MEGLNLDTLDLHFDPTLEKKPRRGKRSVSFTTERGMILAGSIVHYPKGGGEVVKVPAELRVINRPELGELTEKLNEADREALVMLIREKLRYRPGPGHPPEWERPGESITLLRKAHAARRSRRN